MSFLDRLIEFISPDKESEQLNNALRDSNSFALPDTNHPADSKSAITDGVLTVPPVNQDIKLPPGWLGKVPEELVSDIPSSLLSMAPNQLSFNQINNLQQIKDLQGDPSKNPVAQFIERLALFDGAVRMPTSNDTHGHPLGREGCAKTPIEKVLAPAATKFPSIKLPDMNSTTVENARVFLSWLHEHPGIADTYDLKMSMARGYDFKPGDVVIAHKGNDVHMLVAARVPKSWNWPPDALMFVANTGLDHDSRGDNLGKPAMILAQEYIRSGIDSTETTYNNHGPINGPGSFKERNPYYEPKVDSLFTIIRFRNPDETASLDGSPRLATLTSPAPHS